MGRRPIRRTERIVIDETVSNISHGEPANTVEDAAARAKAALHATKQTSIGTADVRGQQSGVVNR